MLASLLGSMASGEISDRVGRLKRAVIIYIVAALAVGCGCGFLLAAGYIAAERHYGAIPAALGFGGGFILLAILLVAVYMGIEAARRARRRRKERAAEMSGMIGAAALALLPSLLRFRPSLFGLIVPLGAVAAYEIYKENAGGGSRKPMDGQ